MTPAERVLSVLRGEMPDQTPFTIYENHLEQYPYARRLQERGLCFVKRIKSYSIETVDTKIHTETFIENGQTMQRTVYETPKGPLEQLSQPVGFTSWSHSFLFKSEEDYPKIAAWLQDYHITSNDAESAALYQEYKDCPNVIIRDGLPLEPMQEIMRLMGTENFCYEWMDNRDEILKLYGILVERNRLIYPIVARSPFAFANYGGNVTPAVIGPQVFRDYYLPIYAEAHQVFAKHGKLLGCHLDDDNTTIMNEIAVSQLDYVEAYDPGFSPSVKEATERFPGKILWLNWPSSWQHHTREEIITDTLSMIRDADPRRFILGITENIPDNLRLRNLDAILDAVIEYGNPALH